MQIAKIKDNKVEAIGEHRALFPNTSFPASGPPADWMTQNSVLPVTVFRPYNGLTEKSTSVDPYIEDGVVYLHKIEALDENDPNYQTKVDDINSSIRVLEDKKKDDIKSVYLSQDTTLEFQRKAILKLLQNRIWKLNSVPGN